MYKVTTPSGIMYVVIATGCDQATRPWCHWVWAIGRAGLVTKYQDRENPENLYLVERIPLKERCKYAPEWIVPKRSIQKEPATRLDIEK